MPQLLLLLPLLGSKIIDASEPRIKKRRPAGARLPQLSLTGLIFLWIGTLGTTAILAQSDLERDLRELSELSATFPSQGFEPSIQFWVSVFAEYDQNDVIFHDRHDVRLVYHVESFDAGSESDAVERRRQQARLKRVRAEVETALRELAKGGTPRNSYQKAIRDRLRKLDMKPTSKQLRQLAETVRTQRGIRSKFADGLRRSGQYLEYMQAIFQKQGLPLELAMLPHVESSFFYGARSSVGATGIWQLMSGTSRSLLSINSVIDDRLDPLAATQAAAAILEENYSVLGNWPLAITAYNHGLNGMRRARAKFGDDLKTIIENHRSRLFGFASKNFYSEFLAALLVVRNREKFFPGIEDDPVLRFDRIRLAERYRAQDLTSLEPLRMEELKRLNPQVRDQVWTSGILPAGIEFRVPPGLGQSLQAKVAQLEPVRYSAAVSLDREGNPGYRVRRGDTLAKIARRFGVNERSLQTKNNLRNPNRIYPGQFLSLPDSARDAGEATTSTYVVRRGDSLALIARRFGTSVRELQELNRIRNRNQIYPGQKLLVEATRYRVRRGDTLARIAQRFQTSIQALKTANRIGNANRIYQGQVLQIPAGR